MNEEMMTTGFTGASDPKGPTAGFDPVMKFRKKIARRKKKIKEGIEMKNGLFQYKVTIPEMGETIVYANNPSELRQKLRLLINYRYRGDIKIERIMPANAAKFFMDKRAKHLRNEEVELDERLGGKGYSRKATKGGGDWPDSDRGAGNKAKRRAGGKVQKKSPSYLAHVHNKENFVSVGTPPTKMESTDEKQMQRQLTLQKNQLEKKKAILKIKNIRKQLQKKTQQLKAKGRVGGNTQDYNK